MLVACVGYLKLTESPSVLKVILGLVLDRIDSKNLICELIGNVKDKRCLIVDDIADSCQTLISVSEQCFLFGAKCIDVYVSHMLAKADSLQCLLELGVNNIYTTNSVLMEFDVSTRCKVIPVEKIMQCALQEFICKSSADF